MNETIINELIKESKKLDKIITSASKRLKNGSSGSLSISVQDGKPRYYLNDIDHDTGKRKRTYISSKNIKMVRSLAQQSYDKKLCSAAELQKQVIDNFLFFYDDNAVSSIYTELSKERKLLLDHAELDNKTYAAKWEEVQYEPSVFMPDTILYTTQKGEKVRSKTEKIIADTLYSARIPYRYEYPLFLDGRRIRPDFTILNKRTRKEYIYEHFGMMDNPDYCNNCILKIQSYIHNGIFPGDQLLMTFESSTRLFSSEILQLMIKKYLI